MMCALDFGFPSSLPVSCATGYASTPDPGPMWGTAWTALDHSEDPWADLLLASGRTKAQGPVRSHIRRRV